MGGCSDEGSGIGRGCVDRVNESLCWPDNGLRDSETRVIHGQDQIQSDLLLEEDEGFGMMKVMVR